MKCTKKDYKYQRLFFSLIGVILVVTFSSITPLANAKEKRKVNTPPGKFALLPFIKGDFTGKYRLKNLSPLVCPVDQVCIDLSEDEETSLFMVKLDGSLNKLLKKRMGEFFLPKTLVMNQYSQIQLDPDQKDTLLARALSMGSEIDAEYILIPILWDYSERVGGKFASIKPASVSFSLYLVSTKQGKRIWKSQFNKTQKALSDNILKAKEILKHGAKWLTAEELAQSGMEEILKKFPF